MSFMFIQSCAATMFDFEVEAFSICEGRDFCGKVAKVGIDLLSGERVCVCKSGRRLRYDPDDF